MGGETRPGGPRAVPGGHPARRDTALLAGALLLLGCAGLQPAAACSRLAAVQEVVWEQDCTGCPQGLRLRFGRDGRAVFTATGKARLRTTDQVRSATLAPADFDRLVAALADAGLFGLVGPAAVHEEPGLADGRWTRWQAHCGEQRHEVFRRESAGPAALDALDAIVQAWRQRLWPPA
jgi:hypothetical protein